MNTEPIDTTPELDDYLDNHRLEGEDDIFDNKKAAWLYSLTGYHVGIYKGYLFFLGNNLNQMLA
jgi:hypothetical protein